MFKRDKMCNRLLNFYAENKNFDWLTVKSPNPYAVVYTKVQLLLLVLVLLPLVLTYFFHGIVSGIENSMVLAGIAMWLGTISWIKTTPADIEQAITKPMLCMNLMFSKIFVIMFTYRIIVQVLT